MALQLALHQQILSSSFLRQNGPRSRKDLLQNVSSISQSDEIASRSTLSARNKSARRTSCSSLQAKISNVLPSNNWIEGASRTPPGRLAHPAPSKRRGLLSTERSKSVCPQAASTKVAIPSHGYDYYELLGLDADASTADIKKAYRWLQKRCHPDVAGTVGHDMAILLNEAYTALIDESTRYVYDQLRVSWLEDEACGSQPVFSQWMGPPEEESAVFVDELQCIGCLKCAVIATNTFAVENRHGRARAVRQWGDREDVINDAVAACPVDCIRCVHVPVKALGATFPWVGRSELPVLEHLTLKLPRGNMGTMRHTAGGERVKTVDIFQEAERMLQKQAKRDQERRAAQSVPRQEAEQAAAEAIRARSGRWWKTFSGSPASTTHKDHAALVPLSWISASTHVAAAVEQARASRDGGIGSSAQPFIPDHLRTLHEAAKKRSGSKGEQQAGPMGKTWSVEIDDDYWTPLEPISCSVHFEPKKGGAKAASQPASSAPRQRRAPEPTGSDATGSGDQWLERLLGSIPVMTAAVAAACVGLTTGETSAQSAVTFESPIPEEIVNAQALHVLLAALVWYAIGAALTGAFSLLTMYVQSPKENVQDEDPKGQ
eukprot:jgi/Mesen1/3076/ME000183S02132